MVAVGSLLAGRYRLEDLLAHGGMASVFAAYDEVLHRRVAVKVHRTGSAPDRRRFDREARVLAGLSHPNLVSVFDAGEEGDDLFLVLELIDGPTLAHPLSGGPLHPDEVSEMGGQLADALAYVHGQGVVHRDVKPSNVMFDEHGQARLGDFGIAHFADATTLTATSTTVGTAAYMAPEQIDGSQVSAKADVYALGLVLLESLTGDRVFPGSAHEAAVIRLGPRPRRSGRPPRVVAGAAARDDVSATRGPTRRGRRRGRSGRPPWRRLRADVSHHVDAVHAPIRCRDPTETMGITATELLPTATASTRVATARPRTGGSRAVLWTLVGIGLLVGAVPDDRCRRGWFTAVGDHHGCPRGDHPLDDGCARTAPPTVDCAALQAEKADLAAQTKQNKHDRGKSRAVEPRRRPAATRGRCPAPSPLRLGPS